MEKFEKAYLVAKETEWWDRLQKAIYVYGETSEKANLVRARWCTYYEICKHFFPEYRTTQTLDS